MNHNNNISLTGNEEIYRRNNCCHGDGLLLCLKRTNE
jgi:hypothetical protein